MVTTRSKKVEEKKEEQNITEQPGDQQEQEAEGEQKAEEKQEQNNQQELRTYRGNCHCGAFVYEAELPEIKSAMECNCSICHKKGYLWVNAKAKYEVIKGTDDTLARYTSGPKKLVHRFCPTCATPVMAECVGGGRRLLNVRAIQGIDTRALEKQPFDGAALGEPYVPPEHEGPLPTDIGGAEEHKLYTGSCHCGAVTISLRSKPIDETFKSTAECNCSICGRNGYHWAYPDANAVVLFAKDPANIGRYSFARHVLNKTFCRICGVCMTNEYNFLTKEERKELGALPIRGFADKLKTQHPVNLRVFPDIDLTKLKHVRWGDGAKNISPKYVNP